MRTQRAPREDENDSIRLRVADTNNVNETAKYHRSLQLVGGKELSLDQLLQACLQAGQEVLWTEFVRRSQPVIAGVIVKTVRNRTKPAPDLIDDLVQETYAKLCFKDFRVLRRFVPRHDNALHGFLKVVASNTVRDHFRSTHNRKRGGGITEVPFDCVAELRAPKRPFEAFERGVLLQEIERRLEAFSDSPSFTRDQLIFWLYYKYGLTTESISRLRCVGLSVKGVESTILRMVRQIKHKVLPHAR